MKTISALAVAFVLLLHCASLSHAGEPTPPAPPAPGPGLLNDWLRDRSTAFTNLDVGGQVRARFEHRKHFGILGEPGSADFVDAPGVRSDNTYLLLREKIHLGYAPFSWFGAFVEARDSSSHNDQRNPNVEADTFDLHQGFLNLGDPKEFPIVAKVGRQELGYGDERLVGASDWSNLGRVFDAAKLRFVTGPLWVEGFAGRVVLPNDDHFNEPNSYDWFSGIYASYKCPKGVTDLYFLARNVSEKSLQEVTTSTPAGGASQRDIYTLGLRLKSIPGTLNGWDYGAEIAGQLGNFAGPPGGVRRDHRAWAAHVSGGYTWTQSCGSPRLGLEYNYASGDSDPDDNDHETFENLFPTNHRFYGYMDFVSWQNIHNLRATGSVKPWKKLSVTLDYHAFWLAETSDYFYQVNGSPRTGGGYGINSGAGRYIGSEIDLVGTCAVTPWASAQVGYGHFFIGDYVKDSLAGPTDADFFYAQLTFSF